MSKKVEEMQKAIALLNEQLKDKNLPELAWVKPAQCQAQKKNARYFRAETFKQLVDNIRDDGHLESVPLVYRDKTKSETFWIISGHHRIRAASEAGVEWILVMVVTPKNKDQIVSKQLSHNEIVGLDDDMVLKELFESIHDVSMRMATGLADKIQAIKTVSLNFKVGEWNEFAVLFVPEDEGLFDEAIEEIVRQMQLKPKTAVRLAEASTFDRFAKVIRKIKSVENIKSNGVALMRMVELAQQQMEQSSN